MTIRSNYRAITQTEMESFHIDLKGHIHLDTPSGKALADWIRYKDSFEDMLGGIYSKDPWCFIADCADFNPKPFFEFHTTLSGYNHPPFSFRLCDFKDGDIAELSLFGFIQESECHVCDHEVEHRMIEMLRGGILNQLSSEVSLEYVFSAEFSIETYMRETENHVYCFGL